MAHRRKPTVGTGLSRYLGIAFVGVAGLAALWGTVSGWNEISTARSEQLTRADGTIASYQYNKTCHPGWCVLYDALPALDDYEIGLQPAAGAPVQIYIVHVFDYTGLPDLRRFIGSRALLTIGTDTAFSNAAQGDVRDVVAITVGAQTFSTPYALHPKIRFWDQVVTGVAWIVPSLGLGLLVWILIRPGRPASITHSQKHVVADSGNRGHWQDYMFVAAAAWLVIGVVAGYVIRIRAGSVEFWTLLYGYAAAPILIGTLLSRFDPVFSQGIPVEKRPVDYSVTMFSKSDIARILIAVVATIVAQLGLIFTIRDVLLPPLV